jgi:hypothetical protein
LLPGSYKIIDNKGKELLSNDKCGCITGEYIHIYMVNNVVHLSFDLNRREQKVVEEVGEVSRCGSGVIETLRVNN